MFIKGSSFTVLYTRDIPKTHNFYKKLGFVIKEYDDTKVVITLADYSLHFILNTTEPFKEYEYITQSTHYGDGIIFYVEVEDLQNMFETVSKIGGTIKSPIKKNHWQAEEFLFEDPNGYKIALYKTI